MKSNFFLLLILIFSLAACQQNPPTSPPVGPLGTLFTDQADVFSRAVRQTGVLETLMNEPGPFTVLLPEDAQGSLSSRVERRSVSCSS